MHIFFAMDNYPSQWKNKNDGRSYFMISLHKSYVAKLGSNLLSLDLQSDALNILKCYILILKSRAQLFKPNDVSS